MKEFNTAVRDAETEQDEVWLTWKIDGVECSAYKPDEAQVAILFADLGRHAQLSTQIAGIIDFFVGILDEKSHKYIVGRLTDRNDPYGINEVKDLLEWIVEEATGNPTEPPSGSTGRQRSSGRRSTAAQAS